MKNLTLKFVLTVVLGWSLAFAAEAQTLRGGVKDANNQPIIGAAVVVEGTSLGASTGVDGSFTLNLPDAKTNVLVVSYVGMKTQQIPVNGRTFIEVVMEEDATALEDVVVVGYGVMKKSDLTGSVGSVAAEDIAARGTVRLEEALQGSVPGVNITQSNSRAGGSFSMQIRGQSS
ncbi:MAG: carboxypeptidase-like regulatory domain-containing protein, partial [Alistipes sp.]|nr:carboxypeptidase-like regulatory domain-containing protein [Alistipes sp.]